MENAGVNCERIILKMSDGYDICIMAWKGNSSANALVISHGMKEYALRYDEVARFFAQRGFAVFAYNHRGHGEEAKGRGELGFRRRTAFAVLWRICVRWCVMLRVVARTGS